MSKYVLESLAFTNWKGSGTDEITYNFVDTFVAIDGPNGSGKSRIVNGWRWLLTGKDMEDRQNYEIKDQAYPERKNLDSVVKGVVRVDGKSNVLMRVYREKWRRPRGAEQEVYDGNETLYFVNDVPFQEKQYKAFIDTWASESMIKIMSDPLFFNTPNEPKWSWMNQRDLLITMAGEVSNEEVFEEAEISSSRRKVLEGVLAEGKKFDDYKKQIAATKKTAKAELEGIPKAIKNLKEVKPEADTWDALPKMIEEATAEYNRLNNLFTDKSKLDDSSEQALIDARTKLRNAKADAEEIKADVQRAMTKDNNDIRVQKEGFEAEISAADRQIKLAQQDIENLEKSSETTIREIQVQTQNLTNLKVEHAAKKAEEEPAPDLSKDVCPTCGQKHPKEKIAELHKKQLDDWKTNRATALADLKNKVIEKDKEITELKSRIAGRETQKSEFEKVIATQTKAKGEVQKKIDALPKLKGPSDLLADLEKNQEYQKLLTDITEYEAELKKLENPEKDTDKDDELEEIKAKRAEANKKQIDLSARLANKVTFDRIEKQIADLSEKEKSLNKIIAEQEGLEAAITKYNMARNEIVTRKVNRLFRVDAQGRSVSFKMFKEKTDGTPYEACELWFGTDEQSRPWGALNNAAQYWAGMECINTFNEHFDLYLPIFMDNREGVFAIPKMKTQVFSLRATGEMEKFDQTVNL